MTKLGEEGGKAKNEVVAEVLDEATKVEDGTADEDSGGG